MAEILVTKQIPDNGLSMLKQEGHYVFVENVKSKGELLRIVKKRPYEAIVSLLTDEIDKEVIEACPNLKIIANYAVGYNNIDLQVAKEKNIVVTNTPNVLTDTVAEHTVALILAAATRIAEADKFVRKGKFKGWEPELMLGHDIKGKTLGIFGAGRIGTEVARICKLGFNMNIVYYDIKYNKQIEDRLDAVYKRMPEDLLDVADVISVHLPLTDATRHFIDSKRLAKMKKDAILVNSSRGPIIDEEALADALQDKTIFAAGLDVFEYEPKITKKLLKLDNVVLTPHIASASRRTREEMSELVAKNVIAVLSGNKANTQVF